MAWIPALAPCEDERPCSLAECTGAPLEVALVDEVRGLGSVQPARGTGQGAP
jgi:hypothetical protein